MQAVCYDDDNDDDDDDDDADDDDSKFNGKWVVGIMLVHEYEIRI